MAIKSTGVGSLVWYLKAIKVNPDNSGINFLTKYKGVDWKTAYEAIVEMTAQGMVNANAKPGSKRINYSLTSFGHRHLEENKSAIDGLVIDHVGAVKEPQAEYSKRVLDDGTTKYFKDGIQISRALIPTKELLKFDTPNQASKAADTNDEYNPAPVDDEPDTYKEEKPVNKTTIADGPKYTPPMWPGKANDLDPPLVPPKRPLDRVVDSAISLGEEIQIHKQDKELSFYEKVNANIAHEKATNPNYEKELAAKVAASGDGYPPQLPVPPHRNVVPEIFINVPTAFADEFRKMLGEIMIPRFAEQVTAKDILDFIEGNNE